MTSQGRRLRPRPLRRRTWLFARAAGLGALLTFAAAGAFWTLGENGAGADPDDPHQVALGRAVYADHCAACHGERLEGQPNWRTRKPDGRLPAPPHDETGHTWHHPDKQLFVITKHGLKPFLPETYESDMPAFDGVLTEEETWAVLAFIKSNWPPKIREHQELVTRNTRDIEMPKQ